MSRVEAALLSPLNERRAWPTRQKSAVRLPFGPREDERREATPPLASPTAKAPRRVQIRPGIKTADQRQVGAPTTTTTAFAPAAPDRKPEAGVEPAPAKAPSWKPSALVELPRTRREAPDEKAAEPVPEPATAPVMTAAAAVEGETLPGLSWTAAPGRGRVPACISAPDSLVATEQYRKLAGALLRAQEGHAINIIMTASALPSEGKSLTTAALAYTLSNSYRRNVLVIDADMRLSSMHEVFGVPNGPGLSDFLEARQRTVVAPVEVMPGLTLLTAGRATTDPVGGLTSARMRQLLREASKRFDWVIIDTPPVTLLPDANLLTAMVDGVVLVIAAGETQFPFLTRAVAALGRDRILGTVLNRAKHGVHLKGYAYSNGY